MKQSKRLIALPLAAAVLTAGAAAVWSPKSCGCVDPWVGVAFAICQPEMKDPSGLTARSVADGLAKSLAGKNVGVNSLPFAESTYDCALALSPNRTVRCRWWLWEQAAIAQPSYRGFDVVVATDSSGVFRSVQVIPITHVSSR